MATAAVERLSHRAGAASPLDVRFQAPSVRIVVVLATDFRSGRGGEWPR